MAERHLTVRRRAAASPASVWAVIADFPNLAGVWSGLRGSQAIGDRTRGPGARRQVDLKPVGSLVETVTAWEEGRTLATRYQPSARKPCRPNGSTRVGDRRVTRSSRAVPPRCVRCRRCRPSPDGPGRVPVRAR
ncbi:SRPBCC family protein [Streptomyces kurssanovii]|uniref:SRPBCC family protein n=1 Tax=Streptomyces kurssanovii TaxID=67312 RepID=A0ABV3I0Y4_9ACTN